VWLANRRPRIDIYHVVKCAFYADKYHVNKYGRPIAGDHYVADTYGPLGKAVYGLMNGDPFEILALGGNGDLPFTVGERWQVVATRDANSNRLSESDVEALEWAVRQYADMTFDELVDESHSEHAYLAAFGGTMRYEDLLNRADPMRKAKAEALEEIADSALL
jgi:uncharacterized phage-associated protein